MTIALPLIPDGDEAREWARRELDKAVYTEAEPTPLDRIAQAVRDFFVGLFGADAPPGLDAIILIGAAVLVVALIVVSFLVWGRPRALRRASTPFGELFAEDAGRTARELRSEAEARAREAEWDAATVLAFRALALGLTERGVIDLPPGTTVRGFVRRVGDIAPRVADDLTAAGDAVEDIRYLRRHGSEATYRRTVDVDHALSGTAPVRERIGRP